MARRPAGTPPRGDGTHRARPGRVGEGAETSARPKPAEVAPPPVSPDPTLVLMGEFGRAQGLKGEIRLKSYTADPLGIAGYGPLQAADGRRFEITDVRTAPGGAADMLVARVRGVVDRTGAEGLNRVALYVARDKLGTPEDEDEFFAADLVGLDAVDAEGIAVGRILSVPNYGGGDLLEIAPAKGGPSALLPFTRAFVPSLDIPGRRIVVALPEDFFAPPGPKPADDPG